MARRAQARPRRQGFEWRWPPAVMLKMLSGVLVLGLLFGGASWLTGKLADPEVMPVRHVGVDGGLRHVSRIQLQRRIEQVVRRGSFFTVDVAAVRKAAREIPWVDAIRVRKHWPDRLHIEVSEKHAVLRWNDSALVDAGGKPFTVPRDSFPPRLANLRGEKADLPRLFNAYRDIQRRLNPLGLRVAELALSPRGAWSLKLDNGTLVELGAENLHHRVARLIMLYPRLLGDPLRFPAKLDLRYANGLSVSWRDTEKGLAARSRSSRGKS